MNNVGYVIFEFGRFLERKGVIKFSLKTLDDENKIVLRLYNLFDLIKLTVDDINIIQTGFNIIGFGYDGYEFNVFYSTDKHDTAFNIADDEFLFTVEKCVPLMFITQCLNGKHYVSVRDHMPIKGSASLIFNNMLITKRR